MAIGSRDSNLELELNVDESDEESDEMTTQFLAPKVLKSDLEICGSNNLFSKIEIEPRSPNLKMELRYKGE